MIRFICKPYRMRALAGAFIYTDGVLTYKPSLRTLSNPSNYNPMKTYPANGEYLSAPSHTRKTILQLVNTPTEPCEYLKLLYDGEVRAHLYRDEKDNVWGLSTKHHNFLNPVTRMCLFKGMPAFYRKKRNGDQYWIAGVRLPEIKNGLPCPRSLK